MTTNKMPTVEEIRNMADFMLGFDPGFHNDVYVLNMHNKCGIILRTIADHQSKSEPVVYCVNAIEDGGSILYVYPPTAKVGDILYTTPLGDTEDAGRYRKLKSVLKNPYAVLPVGDELDAYVDAIGATKGDSHGRHG